MIAAAHRKFNKQARKMIPRRAYLIQTNGNLFLCVLLY